MPNRLAWAYLAAILGIVLIETVAIVALRIARVEIDQALIAQLLGIGTPTLVALLALLRGIGNSQEIQQTAAKVEQHHAAVESQLAVNTELTADTRQTLKRIEGS
jgi:hypothetical protein